MRSSIVSGSTRLAFGLARSDRLRLRLALARVSPLSLSSAKEKIASLLIRQTVEIPEWARFAARSSDSRRRYAPLAVVRARRALAHFPEHSARR